MSEPHFYQAADRYQDAVDGLSPSAYHQTFLDVEPVSQQ
jgi:CD36 family